MFVLENIFIISDKGRYKHYRYLCVVCRVTKASPFEIHCVTSPIPGIDPALNIDIRGCVNGTSGSGCIRLSGRGVQKSMLPAALIEAADGLQAKQNVDVGRARELSDLELHEGTLTGGISRKFSRGFVPNKIRYATDQAVGSDTAHFTVDEASGGLTAVFLKNEFYLRCVCVWICAWVCAYVYIIYV